MRSTIRLFSENFGFRYFFAVPLVMLIILSVTKGGDIQVSDMINPVNVGFLTLLAMLGFSSNRSVITLARLLPTTAGTVAGGLQLSLLLVVFLINVSSFGACLVLVLMYTRDIKLWQIIVQLMFNMAFLVILSNIMLPLMLLKALKPLKVAIVCLAMPMPFIVGEVSEEMSKRLVSSNADWIGFVIFICIAALLTSVLCYYLSKGRIKKYET